MHTCTTSTCERTFAFLISLATTEDRGHTTSQIRTELYVDSMHATTTRQTIFPCFWRRQFTCTHTQNSVKVRMEAETAHLFLVPASPKMLFSQLIVRVFCSFQHNFIVVFDMRYSVQFKFPFIFGQSKIVHSQTENATHS